MFPPLRQLVRTHPVAAFYALAFPLSWRAYLVAWVHPGGELGLDPYGPLVAALLVTFVGGGVRGLRDWVRRLLRWRASPRLYAFALLLPLLVTLLGIGANVALGARPPPAELWRTWPSLFIVFPIVMVLGGPLGEEPAWRGLALARLSERRSMLQASLGVGVAWTAWHLPLLLAHPGELLPGALGILFASVVFGWLYQASGEAVLLPLLMHTAQNTFGGEFAGPMFSGADATRMAWLRGGFYLVTALLLATGDRGFRTAPTATPPELAPSRTVA
ncbi:MAG TPA: CPBP family intramembrane glutamic endopeptidase [Myxococcaceae bacterium]|nr:CPBP family intramembrane glutamic endopeptidase [Myxococcaceae bacterium]